LVLSGTNDVNDENRGIMIEDVRYGRVTIPWSEFDSLTFKDVRTSGRTYSSYKKSGPLYGTVQSRDGASHAGRIVLDMDEESTWEILNGSVRDIAFDIPMSLVKRIEVVRRDEALITFVGGETITLEEGQDVTERNAGVLIFASDVDDKPVYLEWDEVRSIDFQP
jgi:hypothetical protein